MQDFEDFIAQIDREELIKDIMATNPKTINLLQFNASNPVELANALDYLNKETLFRSLELSLVLLRHYHDWLDDQISD